MSRFFTSDLHFNHAPIIGYCERPFDSVEEMNEALISNWNDVVSAEDEVYIDGDLALGRQRGEALQEFVPRLNGHPILLPGNHDLCWSGRHAGGTLEKWIKVYTDAGLEVVDEQIELRLADGTWVDVCHFPYEGDHTKEVRHAEHRPIDRGRWLLHGHIHEKWLQWGRMINVGVDVWDFRPIPEEWIIEMIRGGEKDIPEDHGIDHGKIKAEEIVIEWIQHNN